VADIVVVEDDAQVRVALERSLTAAGHGVRAAANGLTALSMIVDARPEIVVLDLGLPDIDGAELLKMIRAVTNVPILVATARDDDSAVVRTLNAGADDYVVKPFSIEQLDARIRAVLRRTSGSHDDVIITIGSLSIDGTRRVATLDGQVLKLTRKEFDVLQYLAARQGRVVSKRELLAEVWQQPYGGPDKTVDVHLSWLRRKLGETADAPRYLLTVRGVGVRLVDPDEASADARA